METIEKTISINTGDGERSVKSLRKEISDLRDALLNCEKGGEEWQDIVEKLVKDQEDLADVTKVNAKEMDAASDSIAGMEKQYKALYNTYRALSEEQRNSDFGKNMASSLNELSTKLNETKQGVGNFKDNIGRYTQGVMDAFSQMGISVGALQAPMKLATAASNGLGASLKALIANPVGAVIMAIVVAFKALKAVVDSVKEAINRNEESQDRLNEAMAAFEPIGNLFKNIMDKIGKAVVWVAEKLGDLMAWLSDEAKETQGLAKAENELKKARRENQKLDAKDKARVETLREEASETKNVTERNKKLQEAKEIQAQIDQRAVEVAKEDLRIKQERAKLAPNSEADNQALADAETAVSNAEAEAAKNARTFNKQMKETGSQAGKTENAIDGYRKKVEEMDETIRQSSLTEIQKLEEERDKWIEIYKAVGKSTTAVEKYYNQQIGEKQDAAAKEAQDKFNKWTEESVGIFADAMYSILGGSSTSFDLTKKWKEEFGKVYYTAPLKQGTDENGNTAFYADEADKAQATASQKLQDLLRENYRQQILNATFPDTAQVKKEADDYMKTVEEAFKDGSITNEGIAALSIKINQGLERNLNMEGLGVDFWSDETAAVDLISTKLTTLRTNLADLIEQVATGGEEITYQQTLEINDLNTQINNLEMYKEAFVKYAELIKTYISGDYIFKKTSQDGNMITSLFFGSSKDVNGFSTNGNKMGKFLNNSAKVWQDWGNAVTTVLSAVSSAWQNNIEKQLENGDISEDEAKKQFKQMKAMQYGLALISTASGMIQCFSDPSLVTWYAKAAAAASVLATGAAQAITISQTEMGSSSSLSSSSMNYTPPVINDTNPFQYTRNVTTADEEDLLNQPVKAYVVESEVTAKQELADKRDSETSF